MSITKKGTAWELRNSLWLLLPFTLLFNFVAFFWIGGRTGQRKWILCGVAYFLVDGVLPYAGPYIQQWSEPLSAVSAALMMIGWSAAILQALLSRREYLLRLEAVQDLQKATGDAYRNEIRQQYFGGGKPAQRRPPKAPPPKQPKPAAPRAATGPMPPQNLLDLNLAAEQQLAALPGVGVALAKRAVELRMQTGGFLSVDDFCARLQMMPHFTEQIRSRAFASPPAAPATPQRKPGDGGGRIVDI